MWYSATSRQFAFKKRLKHFYAKVVYMCANYANCREVAEWNVQHVQPVPRSKQTGILEEVYHL